MTSPLRDALRTPAQIAAAREACLAVAAELRRDERVPPGVDVGTWLAERWRDASRKAGRYGR